MSNFCSSRHMALLLVSAALLAFQIALLQILATSQWHHFAYLVISIALLGFGVAGTLLSLSRQWMLTHLDLLLPLLLCACAVTLAGSTGLIQSLFGGFDSFLLFVDPLESLRLAVSALVLMVPFVTGALVIGITFTADTERIGSYYFANMLGSGIGCILGLAGLATLTPDMLVPWLGLLALLAAICVLPRQGLFARMVAVFSTVLLTALILQHPGLELSQYKDLRRTLNLPDARIVAHRPSAAGQIHIVESSALRSAAGVSLNWQGDLDEATAVFINGDMLGSLPAAQNRKNPRNASTFALPFAIGDPQKVLILNAGTGQDVALALGHGAVDITAVEPHGELVEQLSRLTAEPLNTVFTNDKVSWQTLAPRTWLARDQQQYDLIILPGLGGFGGNAGLFALHEQPLFTREALTEAWHKLLPEGMLTVTTWVDYPVRNPLRLTTSLMEILEEVVPVPKAHIAAVRSWGTITFCIKKRPLSARDIEGTRDFSRRWGFDPVLLPGITKEERQSFNKLQDNSLFNLLDRALDPSAREALYRNYTFRIEPVSDDRPFFSQFLRWSEMDELVHHYGQRTVPFIELGMLVAGLAALILSLLAVILVLLPMLKLPGEKSSSWRTILYFGGLGIGYMWTELALIHRFEFYLGQPVYAAALVVATLLIGSAIGSLVSERITNVQPWRIAAIVTACLIIYTLGLPPLLKMSLPFSLAARVCLAVIILAPAAIIMGMPFPLGLRRLHALSRTEVPWAWGINGCFSVVGAAIATIIAVEVGYSKLLLLAACAYLLPATIPLRGIGQNGDKLTLRKS